ncbi:MAG: hypothetical protein JWN79_640 [Gemmatimonadetes bacterium]|jgi:hypothetical protein|nr:hypothetical protein [Gemmatimonadota bacterium]
MQKLTSVIAGALLVAGAVVAHGQTVTPMATGRGGSAHVRSTWQVNGATISIEYGRPKLKGRPEGELMPLGKPWRTGADVATILTTDRPLTFGAVTLAPGRYTINTEPGQSAWQLIFGRLKTPDQWGVPYQPDLEIGRAAATVSRATVPDEELTFYVDQSSSAPALRLQWGTTSVSAPFVVGK